LVPFLKAGGLIAIFNKSGEGQAEEDQAGTGYTTLFSPKGVKKHSILLTFLKKQGFVWSTGDIDIDFDGSPLILCARLNSKAAGNPKAKSSSPKSSKTSSTGLTLHKKVIPGLVPFLETLAYSDNARFPRELGAFIEERARTILKGYSGISAKRKRRKSSSSGVAQEENMGAGISLLPASGPIALQDTRPTQHVTEDILSSA